MAMLSRCFQKVCSNHSSHLPDRDQVQTCVNGRENITKHNINALYQRGGLVIQTHVNWREGLDNRMSSGRVIS